MKYLGIEIDLSRDGLLPEQGLKLLQKFYCLKHETSPQMAYARAAVCYSFGDYAFAQRIYDYVSKNWFMYASPVLSNSIEIDWLSAPSGYWGDVVATVGSQMVDDYGFDAGDRLNNETTEEWHKWFTKFKQQFVGMPISCFLTYTPDHLRGLIGHTVEERWLSVKGGGVGGHWSDVRSVSDKAPGPIPFLKTIDADMAAYSQGKTRRGSYAAYLDISHPEILEFIKIRVPTGGDTNRKCLNLNNAINITDAFLEAVLNDKPWQLIDPHDKDVRDTIQARELWEQILDTRNRTGEPYLHYIDESNRHLPLHLKERGLKINGSNLCSEITLPTSAERTAVCCLSSTNIELFDEWKDTSMVTDLVRFLDNVLEMFILCAPPELNRALHSAQRERSIGLGAMGFHTYLQSKNVPWESAMAMSMNRRIFKTIRKQADDANIHLTWERGPCPDSKGSAKPVRLSHLLAIAPNSNSGMIVGVSPSIEPTSSNAYVHESRIGSYLIKSKNLEIVIANQAEKDKKDAEWITAVWKSIETNDGSVQHLEWMDEYTKAVYKTAYELDQRWVVDHARDRQEHIDQAQSCNTFFKSQPDKAYVNQVHLRAFMPAGTVTGVPLKSLYYFRTKPLKQADKVSQPVERLVLKDGIIEGTECAACQG